MSLIDEAMEPCVMLDKQTVSDGYGGSITNWVDGANFNAAITFDISMPARIGAHDGVTSRYTVLTYKNLILKYNDYFRRLNDGKMFRVISDGDDRTTPESASPEMHLRQVEAEEITSLPS